MNKRLIRIFIKQHKELIEKWITEHADEANEIYDKYHNYYIQYIAVFSLTLTFGLSLMLYLCRAEHCALLKIMILLGTIGCASALVVNIMDFYNLRHINELWNE